MSLIFATQLTAVATTVLAVFAIVTGIYAVRAFRRQSQEVAILAEQNERAIHDRRKNQASRVFIWAEAQPSPYPDKRPRSLRLYQEHQPAACLRRIHRAPPRRPVD
jgi:hypothetical protein